MISLSPADKEAILDKAAQILANEVKSSIDLSDLVSIPLDAAEQFTGLGPTQILRRLPIRKFSPRKKLVPLRAIQEYLAKITTAPKP